MTSDVQPAPRSKWRESLDYFLWFYTPFKPMTASDIYELVSTNAFSGKGLYLNLGYWKIARTIDDACEAMAMLVAESAGIGPGSKVIDVGFGFGDQDMLWMERLKPAHITGFNVTRSQVLLGKKRVAERGLSDKIDLREGSATTLPVPDASFDQVVGVESAFHFDTREAFFHEALRALKSGGRLALADVIRADPHPSRFQQRMQRFNWNFFMQKYAVPTANSDDRESYAVKLKAAGFTDVKVESIRDQVYPGLHKYMGEDPAMLRRFHWLARLPYKLTLLFKADSVYSAYNYVLVTARKP